MSGIQILERNGEPAFVVMSIEEYERLMAPQEDAADALALTRMADAVARGEEQTFPASLVDALLAGGNAVRLFREYRGMTPAALATACGVSKAHIYQIETGKRTMSVEVLRKLVAALQVDADMLL